MAYIFGGDTGQTYEGLQRQRAISEAMLERSTRTPRNVGEGLTAIGNALAGKVVERRVNREEGKRKGEAERAFKDIMSGYGGSQESPGIIGGYALPEDLVAPAEGGWSPEMIEAVIQQESGGNPSAVSPAGAGGAMQIMPATARDPGYGVPTIYDIAAKHDLTPPPESGDEAMTAWLADPANQAANVEFGSAYGGAMANQYPGQPELQLAAYNAGPGAVDKFGGVPPYEETQDYVANITGALDGGGSQAPQVAPQAPQGPQGPQGIDPALVEALGNPYLSDGQRAVAQALLGQQVAQMAPPEQMTPYQRAQIGLQTQRLRLDRQKLVADGSGGAEYGLTPIYGTDAEGNLSVVQLGKDGSVNIPVLPEGFKPGAGVNKVDIGTGTLIIDTKTGNNIGFIPKDVAGAEREKELGRAEGAATGDAKASLPKVRQQAETAIGLIDSILSDPALEGITGMIEGRIPPMTQAGTDLNVKLDQLKGKAFLEAFETLKGGGQITEVEGKKAEAAMARLNRAQSLGAYTAALNELAGILRAGVARIEERAGIAPSAPPDDDDVSDLMEKYGG